MRRITRYVLVELLVIFFVTLLGMTMMMIVVGVVWEAVRQHLGVVAIIRLLPFVLPNALFFSVPAALLFAVCMAYGRMSGANEIVALKAMGISPWEMIWPTLVMAFALSLLTVWLNDLAVSWGRRGMNRIIIQSVEEIAYGMLRTQDSYSTDRFSINVKEVVDKTLIRPTVVIYDSGQEAPITLTAQEARFRSDFDNNLLIVEMVDGEVDFHGELTYRFDTHEHAVPLQQAAHKGHARASPSNYALREIPDEIDAQSDAIEQLEQTMAAQAAFELISGDFENVMSTAWSTREYERGFAKERKSRLITEPYRRWANGFSCLCFVMVGIPLAIRLRNSDVWSTFGFCFVPVLLVYYPLLLIGVSRAKSGDWPPYGVWLSNLLFLAAGLWILRKVRRY